MCPGPASTRRRLSPGRRIVSWLDLAIVVLFAAAVAVALHGRYRFTVLGVRVSLSSWPRPWLCAAALLLLRSHIEPVIPALRRLPSRIATGAGALLSALRTCAQVLRRFARRCLNATALHARAGLEAMHARSARDEASLPAFATSRSYTSRAAEFAAVLAGFVLLVALFTWPQVGAMQGVPDRGDPLLSAWRIAWVNHQIWRDPWAVFNANIFHPELHTLAFSDAALVPALAGAPLFWMGLPTLVIYNLLLLGAIAASGVTTYYLVRALTGRRDAACIAGVVFALHPYRLEHYSHFELQVTLWMPLALWALHRSMVDSRLRDGLLTGLAYALQMFSSMYYGMYFAVTLVIVGAALWAGRRFPLRPLAMLGAGAVLSGVLIAPLASQYLAARDLLGDRSLEEVAAYSAEPSDYLKAHDRSYTYASWSTGGRPERQLFPHITPVVLAVVGATSQVSFAQVGYAAAALAGFDASLGTRGHVFPWLRAYVPGYSGLRVPARFSLVMGLSLAILAGFGAARLFERWPRARGALALVMVGAVFVESLPNINLEQVWEPPALYASLATQGDAVVAEFPVTPANEFVYEYFATAGWHTMLNGASGFDPPSHQEFANIADAFPSDEVFRYLRDRGVTHIAWHGPFAVRQVNAAIVRTLEARADLELVAVAPWRSLGEGESRLYRLK